MATENTSTGSYEEDLQRILAEERGKKIAHQVKMVLSWVGLLLILALIFSGLEINLGFTQIKFIELDTEFIQDNISYIANGALQTILISIMLLGEPGIEESQ